MLLVNQKLHVKLRAVLSCTNWYYNLSFMRYASLSKHTYILRETGVLSYLFENRGFCLTEVPIASIV
jgi:hypothetical protein